MLVYLTNGRHAGIVENVNFGTSYEYSLITKYEIVYRQLYFSELLLHCLLLSPRSLMESRNEEGLFLEIQSNLECVYIIFLLKEK
jgi:hypothetical protein